MADPIQGYFNSTTFTLDANGFPIWNRAVGSEFMAKFAHTVLGNGAAAVTTGGFQVVKKTGMTVTVKPYFICKDGYMMYQTAETDITFNSSVSEQVFYIGARLDVANNHFDGDDVGAFTTFVSATDIASCRLTIPANAVAITDGMIEDLRYNTTYCGQIDQYRETGLALLNELETQLAIVIAGGIPDHASTHAMGGDDPITPAAIGAADAREVRAYEYSGREIPFTWAQIQAKIQAADFSGLCVGDYKDIILNGTFYDAAAAANKTIANNVFRMEIAGIDSYYQYADTNVPHHIDFISRDCLAGNLLYNTTATNSGAYIGSALFTTLNGANGLRRLLPSDVDAVILNKRGMTEVKTSASASSWAWNDMGKLWLPTEQEIWGHVTWAEHGYGGGLSVHYPIFQDGLRHIVKGDGNGGGRCGWWCASSVAGSASNFCFVAHTGNPTNASATNATARVPLCFRVA